MAFAPIVVVGAGFAGSVIAERFNALGRSVIVVERKDHIGGNAYDEEHDGIFVHKYGPHIFHTNSRVVVDYVSRFTRWTPYEHRVQASVDCALYSFPVNLDTLEQVFRRKFDEQSAEAFMKTQRVVYSPPRNAEEQVLSLVGPKLYEMFFKGYTTKQWGCLPTELAPGVTARIPLRMNRDSRYFSDSFQAMPSQGYTALFNRLLDGVEVVLGSEWEVGARDWTGAHVIYTGPLDAYFAHCLGRLPYRSLYFEFSEEQAYAKQKVATVNYPKESVPYTRTTEFNHFTDRIDSPITVLCREFPSAVGDPYYPVPNGENETLRRGYKELAARLEDVAFVGRLADYRYYNMDQVVGRALHVFEELVRKGW